MATRKRKHHTLTPELRAEIKRLRAAGWMPYFDAAGNLAAVPRKVGGTRGAKRGCKRGCRRA